MCVGCVLFISFFWIAFLFAIVLPFRACFDVCGGVEWYGPCVQSCMKGQDTNKLPCMTSYRKSFLMYFTIVVLSCSSNCLLVL